MRNPQKFHINIKQINQMKNKINYFIVKIKIKC